MGDLGAGVLKYKFVIGGVIKILTFSVPVCKYENEVREEEEQGWLEPDN